MRLKGPRKRGRAREDLAATILWWTAAILAIVLIAWSLSGCNGLKLPELGSSAPIAGPPAPDPQPEPTPDPEPEPPPPPPDRRAIITWSAPTRNADGSEISDLAGYRIEHADGGPACNSGEVRDVGQVTSYVWEDLPPGRHRFVVRAYDRAGNVSVCSVEGEKTIH